MTMETIAAALPALSAADTILVLTGAGISAESGVPTFRGAGGMWREYRPEELATPHAFEADPTLVWEFYAWRRELVANCTPNAAHEALRALALRVPGTVVVTQNVDGLHGAAGSEGVLELHGSLWRLKCRDCAAAREDRRVPLPELPPRCAACGGLERPAVVWFGESLEPQLIGRAVELAGRAALVLVVGTSSLVQPAASLPLVAAEAGAVVIEVNPDETALTPHVARRLAAPAASAVPEVVRAIESAVARGA